MKEANMIHLPVNKTDIVLEIGSGHNPHPRSDILVDRWLTSDRERQRKSIKTDRPLYVADGTHLPFPDKYFDFVLCNQVIEHVSDPVTFSTELARVARKGLIITPHILRERIFGWHYHKWFIDRQKNVLIFYPKNENQQNQFAHFIHVLFANSLNFRHFINKYEKMLNIYYFWEDVINIKQEQRSDKIVVAYDVKAGEILTQVDYKISSIATQWLQEKIDVVLKLYTNIRYTNRNDMRRYIVQDLETKMICIKCNKPGLSILSNRYKCQSCGVSYKIVNKIPIFLLEKEY